MSVRAVAIRANGFQDWRLRRRIVVFAFRAVAQRSRRWRQWTLCLVPRCTSRGFFYRSQRASQTRMSNRAEDRLSYTHGSNAGTHESAARFQTQLLACLLVSYSR